MRTLILSGRTDLRTPLEDAQKIAAHYPGAVLLDFAGVGHSVLVSTQCAGEMTARFLAGTPTAPCPGKPAGLGPAGYLPVRLRGRKAAVIATAVAAWHNAREDESLNGGRGRLGGLRSGTLTHAGTRVTLHDAVWLRGVRVSGTLRDGHGVLHSAGRAYVV